MKKTVMFFPNGNTAVCIDGQQVPELQQPWLLLFIQFLESEGHDPASFEYLLPGSAKARQFKTSDGWWNWDIEP